MKMRKNSLTARLYRWFYCRANMPQSLCTYFWATVWMYTVIIPYTIWIAPALIFETVYDGWTKRLGVGLFSWGCIWVLGAMMFACTYFSHGSYPADSLLDVLQKTGLVCWAGFIIIGIVIGVCMIREWYDNRELEKIRNQYVASSVTKQDNLIVAAFKAGRDKLCPKLEWEDDQV